MTFHVLTLFPEMIAQLTRHSILGRAVSSGLVCVNAVNIRDFSANKHGQADDAPYGGGAGMVMMAPPVYDAWASVCHANVHHANTHPAITHRTSISTPTDNSKAPVPRTIYLTPQGRTFAQKIAQELSREPALILLCGHYEGIDERVIEEIVTDEISIGDYVLTGGETAALVVMDAVTRLIPGVLGKEASHTDESFSDTLHGALEYPHYTRPPVFRGKEVPEILLSGHHGNIEAWRRAQSHERTRLRRPDLLVKE